MRAASYKNVSKVIKQGKLIAVSMLCVHIETSSLWAGFVNKNRRISVRLVSEEDIKHLILIILIINVIVSYD